MPRTTCAAITVRSLTALSLSLFLMPIAHAQTTVLTSGRITASDGQTGGYFGYSVALSGNQALVGAPDRQAFVGGAYLYDATTGVPTARLNDPSKSFSTYFGDSVALSGNVALVGAMGENFATPTNPVFDQGAAYLFNATTGQETARLLASDAGSDDEFGYSVSLSGNDALIGAPEHSNGSNLFQGAAYVFNTTTGTQTAELIPTDGNGTDFFGTSVALSGSIALIGSPLNDPGGNVNQGAAYLFNATTGVQTAKLVASDGVTGDHFGQSVALDGSLALVGAYLGDGGQGAAYLFDATTGQQLFKFTAPDAAAGEHFGLSVAISGNIALIGARQNDSSAEPSQGSLYAFDVTTGQLIAQYVAGGSAGDILGVGVALNGTNALAGAFTSADANYGTGAAYLFNISTAPEPGTLAYLSLALLPVFGMVRRRKG